MALTRNVVRLIFEGEPSSAVAAAKLTAQTLRREIPPAAAEAAGALDGVKLGPGQAAETAASADAIDRELKDVTGNANEARRAVESVRLAGVLGLAGGGGRGGGNSFLGGILGGGRGSAPAAKPDAGGRSGVGVGPLGSGYGRIGLIGAAVGAGVLTGPAAVPAALGLLAGIPTIAAAGAGGLGVLALAFSGVSKAIGGDQKAYEQLEPAQQQFVMTVRSLEGWLGKLKQTAGADMFPGLEKALHSALSPGTVNAVTQAVAGFSRAIGQAGAAWGAYFGSPRFQQIMGPLMQAGARGLQTMSSAALSLFDAIGVVGRAAIPLTSWIEKSIADGTRFVDTLLRAKDASGQLGKALAQAESSLRLVGGLLGSLARIVIELGKALLPVSQTAIRELTGGLNALAGIIDRNKEAIREIAGTALTGFVTVVKLAADAVRLVDGLLERFVGNKSKMVTAVLAIGGALALALGPEAAGVAGALVAVGLIEKHWTQLSRFFKTLGQEIANAFELVWFKLETGALKAALAVVEPFSHLPGVLGGWARAAKVAMQHELAGLHAPTMDWSAAARQAGATAGSAWAKAFQTSASGAPVMVSEHGATQGTAAVAGVPAPLMSAIRTAANRYGVDPTVLAGIWHIESGSSYPNPYKNSLGYGGLFGTKDWNGSTEQQANMAASILANLLKQNGGSLSKALLAYSGGGYSAVPQVPAGTVFSGFQAAAPVATAVSPFGAAPPFTTNVPAAKLPKVTSGAALLPAAIRDQLSKLQSMARNATGEAALDALTQERKTIETALHGLKSKLAGASGPEKSAIRSEQTTLQNKLRDVNTAIRSNLQAQTAAVQQVIQRVKTTYGPLVVAAQQQVSTAFSRIQADIDAALQEKFSEQAAALGARFYQGGQTPLEKQLADMQAADQLKQLQDAITQASSPEEKAAAQRQLDEYNLAADAAKQRAQADKDYADQLRQLQQQQTLQQEKLDDQLVGFSSRLQDGKASLDDLNGILAPFGISLANIPSAQLAYDMGGTDGNGGLIGATRTLAGVMLTYAEKLAKAGGISAAQQEGAAASGAYGTPTAVAAAVAAGLPAAAGQAIRAVHAAAVANLIDRQTAAYIAKGLSVQGYATGGIFTAPSVIGVGERGAEAVVPLTAPHAGRFVDLLADRLLDAISTGSHGNGRVTVVAGDVMLDRRKVGTIVARPVSAALRRQISYPHLRA